MARLPRKPLLLGPSVSSWCERSTPRIRDERPEHSIRDVPLEAAHRLSARLALGQLLTMVRPAARIAASLADGDHVHETWLRRRFPASESRCLTTSPLEASIGATPPLRRRSAPCSETEPHCPRCRRRSRVLSPARRAWAGRPPLARLRPGASGPRGARCHLRPPQPNGVPGSALPNVPEYAVLSGWPRRSPARPILPARRLLRRRLSTTFVTL